MPYCWRAARSWGRFIVAVRVVNVLSMLCRAWPTTVCGSGRPPLCASRSRFSASVRRRSDVMESWRRPGVLGESIVAIASSMSAARTSSGRLSQAWVLGEALLSPGSRSRTRVGSVPMKL